MCKFHKDVARDIATDIDGRFDPGAFAVAVTAMAHLRTEQFVPSLFGVDGFVPAQMADADIQQALSDARLKECSHAADRFRSQALPLLQRAMARTAARHDLSVDGLHLSPGTYTAQGYKATCGAPPDPTVNGSFLSYAVVHLFQGYDDAAKTVSTRDGALSLIATAEHEKFEPIRAATAHFYGQPQVAETLKRMFLDTVVRIVRAAPADAAAGRGFAATAGCVMCHDDDRRNLGAKAPAPK